MITYKGQEFDLLHGWPVVKVCKGAVYVRIPQDLQRTLLDVCSCQYCKDHPREVPAWDTMGIPLEGKDRTTWVVHAPEWKVS